MQPHTISPPAHSCILCSMQPAPYNLCTQHPHVVYPPPPCRCTCARCRPPPPWAVIPPAPCSARHPAQRLTSPSLRHAPPHGTPATRTAVGGPMLHTCCSQSLLVDLFESLCPLCLIWGWQAWLQGSHQLRSAYSWWHTQALPIASTFRVCVCAISAVCAPRLSCLFVPSLVGCADLCAWLTEDSAHEGGRGGRAMAPLRVPHHTAYVEVTGSLLFGAGDMLEQVGVRFVVDQPV